MDLPPDKTSSLNRYGIKAGVYFIYVEDELVYIGSCSNITRRIEEHIANRFHFFKDKFSYSFIEVDDYNRRINMENDYILQYRPKWNKHICLKYRRRVKHTEDELTRNGLHSKRFRETHPHYYRDYMREKRKRIAEAKIQSAHDTLFGKDE